MPIPSRSAEQQHSPHAVVDIRHEASTLETPSFPEMGKLLNCELMLALAMDTEGVASGGNVLTLMIMSRSRRDTTQSISFPETLGQLRYRVPPDFLTLMPLYADLAVHHCQVVQCIASFWSPEPSWMALVTLLMNPTAWYSHFPTWVNTLWNFFNITKMKEMEEIQTPRKVIHLLQW